jgi:hypothetical protein
MSDIEMEAYYAEKVVEYTQDSTIKRTAPALDTYLRQSVPVRGRILEALRPAAPGPAGP